MSDDNLFYENNNNTKEETVYTGAMEEPVKKVRMKKPHKFLKRATGLIVSAAVFGIVAGASFQMISNHDFSEKDSTVQVKPVDEIGSEDTSDSITGDNIIGSTDSGTNTKDAISTSIGNVTVMDVSSVVENVMPAIVAINSSSTLTQYDFFGRAYNNEVSGSGSGIIIGQSNSEILIVTNNHVVDGATAIEIVFDDETKAVATLKGAEASSDLAVVSVNINDLSDETKKNIKIATLGNSDDVKTGEMAIAIGNALGYGQSVTVGYISALNREVTVDNVTLNLLQTDAAINPGNSGGALLNANGEVIGINSVKYTDTDVEGIGYAIPISDAIPIINELMNREELDETESGYLGITGQDIDETASKTFNMPEGLLVSTVSEGSPADTAGLNRGDIITGVNGKTITGMSDLRTFLSYTRAESTVELTVSVLENGEYVEKTLEVTLGYRPSQTN